MEMRLNKIIRKNIATAYALLAALMVMGCGGDKKEQTTSDGKGAPAIRYAIRGEWAHDVGAFIQGLVIHEGVLYESTGQQQSWIGVIDINTGKPDKKVVLDNKYFGEGITILNGKVYQLTWESKVGFIYDLKTFERLGEFNYSGEGWGLTHDSTHLIMSDGTSRLTFLDTVTLKPVKTVEVTNANGPVEKLNELEYINGYVFANQWETNFIHKIDPKTGKVVGTLDLSPLAQDAKLRNPQADVLNGIAYHHGTGLMLVTGKHWPRIYVLQLLEGA